MRFQHTLLISPLQLEVHQFMNILFTRYFSVFLFVAFVLFPFCFQRGFASQEPISSAMLQRERNAFGFSGLPYFAAEKCEWRFMAGDNPEWAEKNYPDSAWKQASPAMITNNAKRSPELAGAKIGWFRLHFRIDSTLDKRSFAFVMALIGAAEVYVDGRLVGQYGVPSAETALEVMSSVSRFTLQTTLLNLRSDETHVLAVRYSFAHYDKYFAGPHQGGLISLPTGLRTVFMTWKATEVYRETAFQTVIQFGVAIGMPLLAGILHLLLFLRNRQERANMFVGLFAIFTALQAASFALSSHVMGQSLGAFSLGGLGQTIALPSIGVSLWYAAQTLFSSRLPRYHWLILGANILVWIAILLVGNASTTLRDGVELLGVACAFTPLLLLLPVMISALRKKLDGSYILGLGMSVCVFAWTLEVVMQTLGLQYAARPLPIAIFIRFGVYIAIPFSLSILLARRTAHLANSLAEQNELLEVNVLKRTEALSVANDRLQEQNQQLEGLNMEKNEIINIVSHDLKNPIGAVRGLAELVQSDFAEPKQVPDIMGQIIQTSDRMLELVRNLLDVNRLESGMVQLNQYSFDIEPLISTTLALFQVQAAAKNITIHYSPEPVVHHAIADEQAVMQVLDNLISNAIKYSPFDKNVVIRLTSSSDAVRVEVQDEGQGISESDMTKLFGKFARLSARPTGGEHSTGLGLSIVKQMVEAMNGRVWCESEVGKGATFIVELPVAPAL